MDSFSPVLLTLILGVMAVFGLPYSIVTNLLSIPASLLLSTAIPLHIASMLSPTAICYINTAVELHITAPLSSPPPRIDQMSPSLHEMTAPCLHYCESVLQNSAGRQVGVGTVCGVGRGRGLGAWGVGIYAGKGGAWDVEGRVERMALGGGFTYVCCIKIFSSRMRWNLTA